MSNQFLGLQAADVLFLASFSSAEISRGEEKSPREEKVFRV